MKCDSSQSQNRNMLVGLVSLNQPKIVSIPRMLPSDNELPEFLINVA